MIRPEMPLKTALVAISRSGAMMACIVDKNEKLLGIITDSDVRRALLQGASLEDAASKWMNKTPLTLPIATATEDIVTVSNSEGIREIPLLSDSGILFDIYVSLFHESRQLDLEETAAHNTPKPAIANAMFILAGGKGTRLRPVVNDRPKPLAIIGDKPILQTIIQQASFYGIRKFFIAVNYLAHQIEEHLSSHIYQDLDIKIIKESEYLGTAGALGLLGEELTHDLIICNGDILTKTPYLTMLKEHQKNAADLSCVVRPYKVTIPFGVVAISNGLVNKIVEKPSHHYFVNSGIYTVSPHVLKLVKPNTKLDMTDLMQLMINSHMKVSPFVLHEYWMDIGQPEDYHKANDEFKQYFGENL